MGYRFLIAGILLILVGVQLRAVESVVLTQKASAFVEDKVRQARMNDNPYDSLLLTAGPVPQKSFRPPRWLGWAALSIGAVMVLHGVSIRRG